LLAAATVNGKRSYYKPAMRSTGWPDGGAVLVKGRRVRIDASQLHAYYITWLEGKKQQFENVGKDALSAWQTKLNRAAADWAYPSGGLGLVLLMVVILALMGRL
jgi:hypothetical protein